MGKQMSIRELRAALSKIEQDLVEHGEITLTRNGKPIARIQPPAAAPKIRAHRDLSALREQVSRELAESGASIQDALEWVRGPR
ncbi:MAG: hypothetical protein AAF253_00200 [Pseudomonadota bacterium]